MIKINNKIMLLVAFLIVLNLVPIWFFAYPPLQDYPQHLIQDKIIMDYQNKEFDYSKYFDLRFSLIPTLFSIFSIISLSKIFGIYIAGKIFLSIYVILFPLSIFYFLSAVDRRKAILGFFSFIFTYNWFFNKGLVDFAISLPFFFFALGYWLNNRNKMTISKILISTILVLLTLFSHLFSFIILMISVFLVQIFRYKNKKQAFTTSIPFILPIILFAIFWFSRSPDVAPIDVLAAFNPLVLIKSFFGMFLSFSPVLEAILLAAPLLYFAFLFLRKILANKPFSIKRLFDKKYKNEFLILALILLLLFVISPPDLKTWAHFKIRFVPFIVLFFVAWLEPPTKKRLFMFITVIAAVLLVILTFFNYYSINKDFADYSSGINIVERNKSILPITVKDLYGYTMRPYEHFWAYYHIEKGGAGPYIFAGHSTHLISYRENMPAPQAIINAQSFYWQPSSRITPSAPGELYPQLNFSREILSYYDYILLWGKSNDVESAVIDSGFSLLHEKGDLKVYENVKNFSPILDW
ncbi:MAG: hypothetical protein Q7J54_02815 [Candidatus Woesearchaeota archaeon]|nr:hypothetical protein [Candidatus Woesearchaeota archaeon]